jgi:hypothetical protein
MPDLARADVQPLDAGAGRAAGWWASLARRRNGGATAAGGGPRGRGADRARKDELNAAATRAADLGKRRPGRDPARPGASSRAGGRTTCAGRRPPRPEPARRRLRAALRLTDDAADAWREALRPLLGPASAGWWRNEGRLLYDLQRVCVDHEREVYSVNVVEWLAELCRKPLYRPLPKQRLAAAARHLQAAAHRLTRCRLSAAERDRLSHLLHDAHHAAEHRLRAELTPPVHRALDAVDMVPRNAVEAAGRDQMVQEMLDAVLRDGYLNFPGVRDAISRNSLRCHDLRGPGEWVGYDQLMKLDRRLGDALDGVYRRGEIYRYAFQKFSSLLFANPPGRLLTRVLILPAAGAYLILEALQHTLGLLLEKVFHVHTHLLPVWKPPPDPLVDPQAARAVAAQVDPAGQVANPWTFVPLVVTAVLLLLLINSPAFRRAAGRASAAFFRRVGFVLFELPGRLLTDTGVLAAVNSRTARLVGRYVVKPLAVALAAWWLLLYWASPAVQAVGFALAFMLVNVVVNSRPGGRSSSRCSTRSGSGGCGSRPTSSARSSAA